MAIIPLLHEGHSARGLHSQIASTTFRKCRSCVEIRAPQRANLHSVVRAPSTRHTDSMILCAASSQSISASSAKPLRFIQHKEEAFWFYRFLSIVYDHIGMLYQRDEQRLISFMRRKEWSKMVAGACDLFPDGVILSHCIAVNPGHWTVDMRTDALEPARLDSPSLNVQHETLTVLLMPPIRMHLSAA